MSTWGEATKLFQELTPDKILSAVESEGYVPTGRILALNSMENRVLQVELEWSEEKELKSVYDKYKIIKFYRPGRWSKEQILDEHRFLFDLIDADVPVVPPLRNEGGESLHELDSEGIYYCLFDRVGGRVPDELNDEQMEQVGSFLARMHLVGEQSKAEHRFKIHPTTYGYSNIEYLRKNKILPLDLESRYLNAVEKICDRSTPWFDAATFHRIHGDCHRGNLLWTDSGPFWVDFDDMLTGPAVQDLWLLSPGTDEYSKNQFEHLLKGYESIRSFEQDSLRLVEPLRALRFIHFSVWIKKRYEDASFKRAFPDFDSWGYWNQQLLDMEEQLRKIELI
jgi:Ser/Thr protein kinase RdoA (MazF antagonist)